MSFLEKLLAMTRVKNEKRSLPLQELQRRKKHKKVIKGQEK